MSNKTPKYYEGNNLLRHSDQNGLSLMNDDENDQEDVYQTNQNLATSPNQDNGMLNTLRQYQESFYNQQDDEDDEILELEYDSQHRTKAQLPQPHPHQNQPLPIHLESYTNQQHYTAASSQHEQQLIESQHKNHNILLDENDTDIKQMNNKRRSHSNYHTNQTSTSNHYHKYNQRLANEYHSSVNQTHIANNPQQILEDDTQDGAPNNFSRSAYQSAQTNNIKGSSELYVWGRNQNGQLGIEPSIKSVVKIPHMLKLDFQISQISCGKSHTALVTTQGSLYTMGSNLKGQLGLGSSSIKYLSSPELVEALSMWKTQKVICSRNSTFALMQSTQNTDNEENRGDHTQRQQITQQNENQQYLFSWGSEKGGVLGIGKITGNQYFPIKVVIDEENEDNIEIMEISAGRSHVGVIVKKKGTDDINSNCLYMWGFNNYGQLGLWDFDNRNTPTFVDSDFNSTQLSCGDSFTVVLSDENILYSTGSNLQGQLGQGQSINKQNAFAQLSSNLKLYSGQYIKQLQTSDYAAVITSNGDMYIWGPTPIGQFNSPQSLQDLIQNNIPIKDMSLGTSFGLIQDENLLSYQLGSLFQENKNTSNFQFLENMYFLKFQCGHDFVIASAIPNTNINQNKQQKGNQKQLVRSSTQSALQHHKNVIKRRQPSGQQQHLPQILSQSQNNNFNINLLGQKNLNHSPSPLRISNNYTIDITSNNYNNVNNTTQQLQYNNGQHLNSTIYGQSVSNHMSQTISHPQNQQQNHNTRCRANERKHMDSCTPVRRDLTPTSTNNKNNQNTNTNMRSTNLQHTPSQANTPNNMRLRIQNQNGNNNHQQQLNHIQSYAASNADDLLSQTLINTPQHMRRTFHAGQPHSSLLTHNQQNPLTATPPPFNNYIANNNNNCNCGCGPNNGGNHNPMCLSQSYAGFHNFGGLTHQSLMFQSIDQHHTPHQFNQTQQSMYGLGGHGYNNHNHNYQNNNNIDLLIREKQEMQHQMQVEIQRRLMQEKELQEAYRQLDSINTQHELTSMLDLTKRDNDNLMHQVEEQDQEIQALKSQSTIRDEEQSTLRAMYEELQAKQQTIQRENEYLKTTVQVAQQFQQLQSNITNSCNGASNTNSSPSKSISLDKLRELEDTLQRKSKEIYDLTVQLGCLKEENTQLKKDAQELQGDYQERLDDQKLRAEAELQVLQEDNDAIRKELDELKNTNEELEQFKLLNEDKDDKIEELKREIERMSEEIETKDDNIRIHKREISILQNECDKLLKELRKTQTELEQQKQQQQQISSKKHSRQSSINLKNKKALHLSTVVTQEGDMNESEEFAQTLKTQHQGVSNIAVDDDDEELDIEDLRRAADEILKDKHVSKTSTTQLQSKLGTVVVNMKDQKSSSNNNNNKSMNKSTNNYHQHQHTQILNPIETPLESQRDSSISQPTISAQVISQQHHQQQQQYSRQQQHTSNIERQSLTSHPSIMHSSQMTPKQMMYQQLKQSMGFGKDSRAISNREQGCLQVANTQRRKSSQANYSNQVKNLRSSKSGTNLKSTKAAVTSRLSNNNISAINNTTTLNNAVNMNKTEVNIRDGTNNHNENKQSMLMTQRNSISNLGHHTNNNNMKSPINYQKRQTINGGCGTNTTTASQIKLSKHRQHCNASGIVEIIDMQQQQQQLQQQHPLDSLLTESLNSQYAAQVNSSNKNFKQQQSMDKSPLRQIIQNNGFGSSQSNQLQNSSSTQQLHLNKSNGKTSQTPLSQMYQKHNLYHNNQDTKNRMSAGPSHSNSKNHYQRPSQTVLLIDENTTPTNLKSSASLILPQKQHTNKTINQNKSVIGNSSTTTTMNSRPTTSQSKSLIINTGCGAQSNGSTIPNTQTQTPKNTHTTNNNHSAILANNNKTSNGVMKDSTNTNNGATNSTGSLVDMKHKLQDIQQNKQYLEKKIYEYERKLNELKGISQHSSSNLSGTAEKQQCFTMTQSYNGGSSNAKMNTLSAAILEKVLNSNKN